MDARAAVCGDAGAASNRPGRAATQRRARAERARAEGVERSMGCASSRDDVARGESDGGTTRRGQDDDDDVVLEIAPTTTTANEDDASEREGGDDRAMVAARRASADEEERRGLVEVELRATTTTADDDEKETILRRLRAMESLVQVLPRKCEALEMENAALRELLDDARRDARRFCGECEIETEVAMERARTAISDARRVMHEQRVRYEDTMAESEREGRHRLAMATLKSKSEYARAKLRASEAVEECERYRAEIERLRDELERLRDERVRDAALPSTTNREDDLSTVSDFGRDSVVHQMRWRLWASELTRNDERSLVRDAEDSLEMFAHLQVQLDELKREKRSATSALEEMNSLLIESRDEVYDLKHALKLDLEEDL